MNLNFIDLIIVAFITYQAFIGFKKGLSKLIFDLAGILVGFFFGYQNYELIGLFLENQFKIQPPYSYFISFCTIWLIIYLLVSLIGKFLDKLFSFTGLGIFNRILGSFFNILFSSFKLLIFIIPLLYINSSLAQSSFFISKSKPIIIALFDEHISNYTKTISN